MQKELDLLCVALEGRSQLTRTPSESQARCQTILNIILQRGCPFHVVSEETEALRVSHFPRSHS